MILSYVLPLLLSFTPSTTNTNNTFYQFGGSVYSSDYCPNTPIPSDTDKTYYLDAKIECGAYLSYDDVFTYIVDRINFRITATAYYYDLSLNNIVVDRSVVLNVSPQWAFSPSNYYEQLENTTITIGIDGLTDCIKIDFDYELEDIDYEPSVHETISSEPLDVSYDDIPTSKMVVSLNATNFFTYINDYCGAMYGDDITAIYDEGYSNGYADGFNNGVAVDTTAVTIFNGILNIALVPINFFLAMFNFEVLGINISQLVSSILSICLVIIVVRFVTGKSQGGSSQ